MKDFGTLSGCRRKEARDMIPCITQPDSLPNTLSSRTCLTDAFDLGIREERVVVE